MKTEIIDGISWPVPEDGDFQTYDDGKIFPLFEDENGDRYYAYGHVPADEFMAEVNRYLKHMLLDDDLGDVTGRPEHVFAKFTDVYGDGFWWKDITEETPHAFPMTMVML